MNIEILPWDIINDSIKKESYIRIPAWGIWIETTGEQKFVHDQIVAIWYGLPAMSPDLDV